MEFLIYVDENNVSLIEAGFYMSDPFCVQAYVDERVA